MTPYQYKRVAVIANGTCKLMKDAHKYIDAIGMGDIFIALVSVLDDEVFSQLFVEATKARDDKSVPPKDIYHLYLGAISAAGSYAASNQEEG